jgi:hypothetical protein
MDVELLLSHARDVNPEGHVPENNSNVGLAFPNLLLPFVMLDNVIVALELTATNLYQTSSSARPPQETFAAMPDEVALVTVPAVEEQVVDEFNNIAPPQSSFTGAAAKTN